MNLNFNVTGNNKFGQAISVMINPNRQQDGYQVTVLVGYARVCFFMETLDEARHLHALILRSQEITPQ